MAGRLIDEDPQRAHEHALAASRRAGRIAVVRESVAITAYATGDYALALRELRTYRRISGNEDQIALMVDSERGVGRPDRAIEVGRAVERNTLPVAVRVSLAIALSGARLDLGETERALAELDIPELDPDRAFEWSPALFAARAAVLEELGRDEEAAEWTRRADIAAEALDEAAGNGSDEEIYVEEIFDEEFTEDAAVDATDADEEVQAEIDENIDDDADQDDEDDYSIAAEVEELLAAADAAADAQSSTTVDDDEDQER
ncbi:tetratricopeptide repeat protein [Microbacterium sp. BG28]|uniref:tetratricopeptide repeat protein n=1 Tax=Microbacterium sp. BG28 TaxID=3097356 RepID=UPI002A5B0DD0|nr:tetratricopeptide repeat protein [Microbacterium sp. BG28]MDY0829668.1 tetratricopeptide repeat protein [Microbacterium sp. BG28]